MPSPTATKVDASKTKTKSASAAASQVQTGPFDPFASSDPFAEAESNSRPIEQLPKALDKIHVRE